MTELVDSIERLLAELKRIGITLTPLQIADALIFAARQQVEEPEDAALLSAGTFTHRRPSEISSAVPPEVTPIEQSSSTPAKAISTPPPIERPSPITTALRPPRPAEKIDRQPESMPPHVSEVSRAPRRGARLGTAGSNAAQVPIEVSSVAALPNARALVRALRPLKRIVPSRAKSEFDEEATVAAVAEEGILRAVERPAGERWLRLALVEDVGPSMVLWRQTIDDFASLLASSGMFLNLTRWSIVVDASKTLLTARGSRSDKHDRHELLEPEGRQIILLITDLVSEGWHNGTGAKFITPWAEHGVLSMVNVLPPSMWRRTGLRDAHHLWLTADPSPLHGRLTGLELHEEGFGEPGSKLEETASFPVLNFGSDWFANWSRLLSGRAQVTARGVKLPLQPEPRAGAPSSRVNPSLDQVLRSFRGSTSPNARKLASYFAAVPLTLPILRLVQRVMMPNGSQPELAEVLLSGLIRRAGGVPLDDEEPVYDFIAGAREELLASVPTSDVLFLLARTSDFISARINHPINFRAWLLDGEDVSRSLAAAPAEVRYFAEISAATLRKLGGKYTELANRLETASDGRPSSSATSSAKAKERSSELERQLDGLRQRIGIYEQSGDGHQTALAWRELGSMQRSQGLLSAAIEAFETAGRLWLGQNGVRNYANVIGDAAILRRLLGQWDECILLLEERRRAAVELADQKIEVSATLEEARVTADRGFYSEASKRFGELVQQCASLGFDREAAVARYEQATASAMIGEDASAISSLLQAKSEFERLDDYGYLAQTLGAMARIEHGNGRLGDAFTLQEQKLEAVRTRDILTYYLSAFGDVARVNWDLGKSELAYENCRERLLLSEVAVNRRERGFALSEFAYLERSRGNFSSALEMQKERLLLFQELREARQCAFALIDIARLEHDRGNSERAMELLREQLPMFVRTGEPRQCAFVRAEMGRISGDAGHNKEALALHEERLATFRELSEPREIAFALADIARLKARAGELVSSVALHQERRQIAIDHGYTIEEASALVDLGWQYLQRGEWGKALESFEQALERYDRSRFARGRGWGQAGRAAIERNRGNIDAAFAANRDRIQILEQTGSLADKAFAWIDLGWLLKETGELREAEQLFQKARALVEGTKFIEAAISSRLGLAALMRDRGELEPAIDIYREGLADCQELGVSILGVAVSMDLGRSLRMQGSSDEARELFERTLANCREIGLARLEGQALTEIGIILVEQGSDAQAVAMFERSMEIATKLELPRDRIACLAWLGRSRLAVGNVGEAISLQQERLQIATKLALPREQAAALQDLGRLDRFKGELASASGRFEEALTMVTKEDALPAYAYLLMDLAIVARDRGAIEEASSYVERIVEPAAAVFTKRDHAAVLRLRAQLAIQREEFDAARPMLDEALSIFEELRAIRSIGGILGDIAELEIRREDLSASAAILARREESLRGLKDPVGESDLLRQKAKLQMMRGDLGSAIELVQQAGAIAEGLGWFLGVARIRELSGEIRQLRGEETEALNETRRAQESYLALGNRDKARRLDDLLLKWVVAGPRRDSLGPTATPRVSNQIRDAGSARGESGSTIFSLEVVPARTGSCLLLHFGSAVDRRIILIDGGTRDVYRSQLRPRLEEIWHERLDNSRRLQIDQIVVTCLDSGHVDGLRELMRDLRVRTPSQPAPSLEILGIWHNSFADMTGLGDGNSSAGLEGDRGYLESLSSSTVLVTSNELRSDARALGIPLNAPFNGKLIVSNSSPVRIGEVEFTTLYPTADAIEAGRAGLVSATMRGFAEEEISADFDESAAIAAGLSFLVRSGGKQMLLAGRVPGDRILQGLERMGGLRQGGLMYVDILTVPMIAIAEQVPFDFFQRLHAQHYVFLGNGEGGVPERELLEMLLDARGFDADYLVHFSYPLREIDRQREEHWNRTRAELRQRSRRPTWDPKADALVSFVDTNQRFGQKVRIAEAGTPNLIDLLELTRL